MSVITFYTAKANARGGRAGGAVETDDGALKFRLELPKELGGGVEIEKDRTNPEQLFACAWAASFADAIGFVARQHNRLLEQIAVACRVSFGQYANDGFGIAAEFEINLPEVSGEEAEMLVAEARAACPYCKFSCGGSQTSFVVLKT
jgi:lipoyl-dependent peroxiredoxin